jgi:hypothetical protein
VFVLDFLLLLTAVSSLHFLLLLAVVSFLDFFLFKAGEALGIEVHDHCFYGVVSLLGFEGFFGVEVAADQGLYLVDDIQGLIVLDVVDEVDAL